MHAIALAVDSSTSTGDIVRVYLMIAMYVLAYLMPTGLAILRGHHNTAAIAVVNVLLGLTCIGWVVALTWALTTAQPSQSMSAPQLR